MLTRSPAKLSLMDKFPDFRRPGFDIEEYNLKFHDANYVINARARQIDFNKHWGCLSIKCAFLGNEFYECNGGLYSVNESSFLILNEGTYYSSYIDSESEVESFTINFTPAFEREVCQSLMLSPGYLLDNVGHSKESDRVCFTEKLFRHGGELSRLLYELRDLTRNWDINKGRILEYYFFIYKELLRIEHETQKSIGRVEAVRDSTKKELFVRLNRARDFILSNYRENLTLAEIADVSCLNQFYFLRQFKKLFKQTPHQYHQHRRIQEAAVLLKKRDYLVGEVCNEVGFSDPSSFSKLFKKHFGVSPIEFGDKPR